MPKFEGVFVENTHPKGGGEGYWENGLNLLTHHLKDNFTQSRLIKLPRIYIEIQNLEKIVSGIQYSHVLIRLINEKLVCGW